MVVAESRARASRGGAPTCNYPPVYIYVLRGLAGLHDLLSPGDSELDESTVAGVFKGRTDPPVRLAVWLFKLPAVLADMATGALLFFFLSRRHRWKLAAAIGVAYVLMPAVIHNSTVWGQVDAVPTLLVILSLELARRRRPVGMTAVAMLSLLTKAQAAMMMPLWLVIVVCWAALDARRWLVIVATAAAVPLLVLLPFRPVLAGVWEAYAGASGFYPFVHLNGFSAWFLAAPLISPHLEAMSHWYVSDASPTFLGLGPRHLAVGALLVVWAYVAVVLWRRRCDERSILWAARLLPLGFFVLSTQMHERYLFPAIAIWAWAFVPTRRWWIGWSVVGAGAAVNALWTWPGPAAAPWTAVCDSLLHREWLGLAPGVWCSLALLGLVALVATGWIDGLWAGSSRSGSARHRWSG